MSFLGKLLKTAVDVVTIPIDLTKDIIEISSTTDEVVNKESNLSKKFNILDKDIQEMRDEADKL